MCAENGEDYVSRFLTEEEFNAMEDNDFIIRNGRLIQKEYASLSLHDFCDLIAKQMDQCPPNDIENQSSIYNSINRYGFDDDYEYAQRQEIVSVCANHGNLSAMMEMASDYSDLDMPDEFDSEQQYWLHKIIEDDRIKSFIRFLKEGKPLVGYSDASKEHLGLLTASACYSLGLHYRASENLDDLHKAYDYLSIAHVYGYQSYPRPSMTGKLLEELKKRIDRLERYEQNQNIEGEMISLFRGINIDTLKVDDQINILHKKLIEEISLDIWNQFSDKTQSYLLTAVSCFYYLLHATGATSEKLDYSCVTVLLMKCLEYELKIRFCEGYIDYLKPKYSVEQFFRINGIENATDKQKEHGGIISPIRDERGRIRKDRNRVIQYTYAESPYKDFTLGSFNVSTGIKQVDRSLNQNRGEMYYSDRTMLDYCKEELFRERNCTDQDTDDWLRDFATWIKDFPKFRNESAHGGYRKNECDAAFALDNLILTEHILINLIKKCRHP